MPDPEKIANVLSAIPLTRGGGLALKKGIVPLVKGAVKGVVARGAARKMPIPEPPLPIRPGVHPKVIPPAKPAPQPKIPPEPKQVGKPFRRGKADRKPEGPSDPNRAPARQDAAKAEGQRLLRFRDVVEIVTSMLKPAQAQPIIVAARQRLLWQKNKRERETLAPLYPGAPTRYVMRRRGGAGHDARPTEGPTLSSHRRRPQPSLP